MNARFAIALLALLIGGCAAYTPRLDQAARPAPTDAFIYGRFSIDARSSPLALDGHNTMGFSLQCRDGSNYILRFYNAKPLHVIKVQPSTCSLTETIFSNMDGMVRSRKPYTGSLLQNVEFKAGTGYYVGDFFAVASGYSSGNTYTTTWRVVDAKSNYTRTTSDLKAEYSGLKDLRTEDLTRRLVAPGGLPDYAPGRPGAGSPADMLDELPLPQ